MRVHKHGNHYLKEWTVRDRREYRKALLAIPENERQEQGEMLLIRHLVCNEDGSPCSAEDILDMPMKEADELVKAAFRLNGIPLVGEDDPVQEAKKN